MVVWVNNFDGGLQKIRIKKYTTFQTTFMVGGFNDTNQSNISNGCHSFLGTSL